MDSKNEPNFRTAVIAPETMEVEQNLVSPVHSEMAGSALRRVDAKLRDV